MNVALVTEVFHGEGGEARLVGRLREAADRGAGLAVLPELPLDPWIPVRREPRPEDAESAGGRRATMLARAAREAGLAVLGGGIVRDGESGRHRFATAWLVDAEGRVLDRYRKLHLPEEEGFWETAHYEPGDEPPRVVEVAGFPVGIQICSDVNRPDGAQLLVAGGAEAILAPRATPPETWWRWRLVLRASAVTGGVYVVSVNRPAEPGSPVGGPTMVVAPDGEVVVETTEPLVLVALDRDAVRTARREYPGYLPFRADVYARAWEAVAGDRVYGSLTDELGVERIVGFEVDEP